MYADDSLQLFEIFKFHVNGYLNEKQFTYTLELPNLSAGSKQLQQISWKSEILNAKELDKPIIDLIEYIWNEAIGDLQEMFDANLESSFKKFTIEQVKVIFLFKKYFK